MGFWVVIPARMESKRLPGKPLLEINGKSMIEHVYRCATSSDATQVVIATDSEAIRQLAESFGATVCMTSADHFSGTDRLAEVVDKLGIPADDTVVNLQGDEPLMPAACINQVAALLQQRADASVSTLCEPITAVEDIFDPDIVKVVMDAQNTALYFSRAPIPWHREAFASQPAVLPKDKVYFRHIGLYASRAGYLADYVAANKPLLEQVESLEQLRIMWHGKTIAVAQAVETPGPGVDTPQDMEKVSAEMRKMQVQEAR